MVQKNQFFPCYFMLISLCTFVGARQLPSEVSREQKKAQQNLAHETLSGHSITDLPGRLHGHNKDLSWIPRIFGVFQRLLKRMLLKMYRDKNGSRIVIQINGRCIAKLFKSIGAKGRCDFPEDSALDPWPPSGWTAPSPEGSPAKNMCFCAF